VEVGDEEATCHNGFTIRWFGRTQPVQSMSFYSPLGKCEVY
jgi:hypothetical protein